MEEQARLPPIPADRTLRNVPKRGDLGEGEAAEEVHVHQFSQRGLERCQFVERLAESFQLFGITHRIGALQFIAVECDLELPATLLRASSTRVVDDQPAHRARGITEETR